MEFSERYEQYMYSYPHKTAYRSLHGINFIDYFPKREEEMLSLYFHIPFCESKCGYCNLFSVNQKVVLNKNQHNAVQPHEILSYPLFLLLNKNN